MFFIFPLASHFVFEFIFDCLVKIKWLKMNEQRYHIFTCCNELLDRLRKYNQNSYPEKGKSGRFWLIALHSHTTSTYSVMPSDYFLSYLLNTWSWKYVQNYRVNVWVCWPCQPCSSWHPQKSEPCLFNALLKQDQVFNNVTPLFLSLSDYHTGCSPRGDPDQNEFMPPLLHGTTLLTRIWIKDKS